MVRAVYEAVHTMPFATGISAKAGQTGINEYRERHGMTAVLFVLAIVLGALCLLVLRSLVTNEDVDEL